MIADWIRGKTPETRQAGSNYHRCRIVATLAGARLEGPTDAKVSGNGRAGSGSSGIVGRAFASVRVSGALRR